MDEFGFNQDAEYYWGVLNKIDPKVEEIPPVVE